MKLQERDLVFDFTDAISGFVFDSISGFQSDQKEHKSLITTRMLSTDYLRSKPNRYRQNKYDIPVSG